MTLIGFLILFPLLIAAILLFVKREPTRRVIVSAGAIVIAITSVACVVANLTTPRLIQFSTPIASVVCTIVSILIAAVILRFGIKYKNTLASVLAIIQLAGSLVFEFGFAHGINVEFGLYIDHLSLLMTFIIGVVGGGICIYALGYMEDFQAHEKSDAPDRRPIFFALMFLFLSAMYVIVFSNNILWLFTGWEITTVCSFLLIGYTKTQEAIQNAFRQIIMNLLGGIGFLVALFLIAAQMQTLSLAEFIEMGLLNPALATVPVCALAFAGITKAAQMPFHTWLLGAMVAPTPTSALLHSSTMVKAGVFILIKLAPLFLVCQAPAIMVILVGGLTFMLCSFMAISQKNAKRVLAYSTVANLGLIVACAGVGTTEAVWSAMFLLLFHAVAKSLLFLCVGTAEHHIGSRNIEDMDLLFERMPCLVRLMMAGIMVMFIAPFGMLIAKWATLVSFATTGNVGLIIILGFGSAATFMFWAKWLAKLTGIAARPINIETTVHRSEWVSLILMVVLCIIFCISIPAVSYLIVEPYIETVYGYEALMQDNYSIFVTTVLSACIFIVLFAGFGKHKAKPAQVYLSGITKNSAERTFTSSMSTEKKADVCNWYLKPMFGESVIKPFGNIACTVIMACAFCASVLGMCGIL